jgi:hypothetical protein
MGVTQFSVADAIDPGIPQRQRSTFRCCQRTAIPAPWPADCEITPFAPRTTTIYELWNAREASNGNSLKRWIPVLKSGNKDANK